MHFLFFWRRSILRADMCALGGAVTKLGLQAAATPAEKPLKTDTLSAVALDAAGHVSAAVTTSGWASSPLPRRNAHHRWSPHIVDPAAFVCAGAEPFPHVFLFFFPPSPVLVFFLFFFFFFFLWGGGGGGGVTL